MAAWQKWLQKSVYNHKHGHKIKVVAFKKTYQKKHKV
jgi:hypothetical protein